MVDKPLGSGILSLDLGRDNDFLTALCGLETKRPFKAGSLAESSIIE